MNIFGLAIIEIKLQIIHSKMGISIPILRQLNPNIVYDCKFGVIALLSFNKRDFKIHALYKKIITKRKISNLLTSNTDLVKEENASGIPIDNNKKPIRYILLNILFKVCIGMFMNVKNYIMYRTKVENIVC